MTKTAVNRSKTVVIGLDGADWRVLNPLMAAGKMPTLAKLVAEGASGELRSTIRPESSVAWSTFATGVNPGKHGVFGFMRPDDDRPGRFEIANGATIQAPRFWDLLAEAGLRSGLLHLPFTYPVRPLNGFCVSGMMTPATSADFVYPPALRDRLLEHFPEPLFDIGEEADRPEVLLQAGIDFTRFQVELARFLLDQIEVDLFCVVLTAIDRIQHFAWPAAFPLADGDDPITAVAAMPKGLVDFYVAVDQAIAALIEMMPAGTITFLASDHGFNGVGRKFYVNKWLVENGYLVLKQRGESQRSWIVSAMEAMKGNRFLRRVKRALLPDSWGPNQFKAISAGWPIDREASRVSFAPDGGLRLNQSLTGRGARVAHARIGGEAARPCRPGDRLPADCGRLPA